MKALGKERDGLKERVRRASVASLLSEPQAPVTTSPLEANSVRKCQRPQCIRSLQFVVAHFADVACDGAFDCGEFTGRSDYTADAPFVCIAVFVYYE